MKAIFVPADSTKPIHLVGWETLDDLQGFVGGNIDTIPYRDRDDVAPYFNEEGKLLNLPPNERATFLLRGSMFEHDYIAGDCLFVGFDPETGAEIDIPEDWPEGARCPRPRPS